MVLHLGEAVGHAEVVDTTASKRRTTRHEQVSHEYPRRTADTGELKIIPGLGLADLAGSGLPDRLAGKVEGELELFADRMRHGLLAAAVAVGLQVFD